jgi:quinol monooxygenase YgiN
VETDRRDFLKYLAVTAATAAASPALPSLEGGTSMYGLIAKITAAAGKRDAVIATLKEAARDMPGCFSYVAAKDSADENVIWVTEVWDSMASHDASLSLPAVKNAVSQSKTMVAGFEKIAVTTPIWGHGLPSAASG